ncbi:MAG: serine hydrolase domain-containing protein, partial [Pyrinomonadaceae bacterium]
YMRSIRILTAAALLLSFTTVSFGQLGLSTKRITFKKEVFEQNLSAALAPQTRGYQYVLIKDGRIVSEKADGLARVAGDGKANAPAMTMKPTTPINIGSLFKFISGTAMLNIMETPPQRMGLNYKKKNFDGRLNTPMWGELPKVWLDEIPKPGEPGPTQRNITFRQLLQHRSGFDDQWNASQKGGRDFLEYLSDGFLASQHNQREYSNMNFVMVGYMIPLLERHHLNYAVDEANSGKSKVLANANARLMIGGEMDKIVRTYVTNKFAPKMNMSCNATKDYASSAAYGYSSMSDTTGVISSSIDTKGHCGGEGGYYMSARDFANYIAHFSASNKVVSKTVRDKMFNESMNPNDRLVWAAATGDNWMNTNFGMPNVAWSNGGTNGTRTVLLRLPQNYYLMVFSNMRNDGAGQGTSQLYNLGLAAFKAGMQHNF